MLLVLYFLEIADNIVNRLLELILTQIALETLSDLNTIERDFTFQLSPLLLKCVEHLLALFMLSFAHAEGHLGFGGLVEGADGLV